MAGEAKIGALHVALGLDTAQFTAGLKKAHSSLAGFSKAIGPALNVAAAGAAAAVAGLSIALKGAVDRADELGKLSQKVGVSTEALSRLNYGAKLSDITLDQLGDSLKKLSVNLASVAGGAKGGPATAFQALGVSVTDASGKLRASNDVFADVAEAFSHMEDGTVKTNLAVQLFGKSGSELIPLLNAGRQGLDDFAAASDRTGNTISGKTAKAAEQLNDSLTTLQSSFDGAINKVIASDGVISAMDRLAGTFASKEMQDAIVTLTSLLVGVADVLARTVALSVELGNVLPKAVGAGEDAAVRALPGQQAMIDRARGGWNKIWDVPAPKRPSPYDPIGTGPGKGRDIATLFDIDPTPLASGLSRVAKSIEPVNTGLDDARDKFGELGRVGEDVGDGLASAFSSMTKALLKGEDATGALLDGLSRIGDKFLDAGFKQGFDLLASAFTGAFGGGGGLGGALKGLRIPRFAGGTNFAPGGMALVGEYGPELVNLPRGSQVFPNGVLPDDAESMRVGNTYNIAVHGNGDRYIGQIVADAIKQYDRTLPQMVHRQALKAVRDPYAIPAHWRG